MTRRTGIGLAAAALLLVCAALFLFRLRREMSDFEVNYRAGRRLWRGETLYRPSDEHWQFKYSPASAMLYAPLALLPEEAAKAIWLVVVAASSAAVLLLAAGFAAPPGRRRVAAGLLAGLVLARFFLRELQLGQINALVTAGLMGTAWLLSDRAPGKSDQRSAWAGVLWGAATALKPYAVIFLPYFVLKRAWRVLGAGIAALAASILLPALFYGFRGDFAVHREWATTLSRSTPGLLASQDNVSLLAFLVKTTGDPKLAGPLFAVLVAGLMALTLAFVRRGGPGFRTVPSDAALLLLFIPLLSPLGWDYTFLAAAPAAAAVLARFDRLPLPGRALLATGLAAAGFSFYDLLGRRAYAAYMAWSIPTVCFLVLAAAVFYLRWKNEL